MRTGDATHFRHTRRGTGSTLVPNTNPNSGSGQLTATNGVSSGPNHYFEIGGSDDGITSTMIRWFDSTSSATITLETTNLPVTESAFNSTTATEWAPEPVVITGPVASASGCFMLHMGNNGAKRNRLKFVVAANTSIEIISHGVH